MGLMNICSLVIVIFINIGYCMSPPMMAIDPVPQPPTIATTLATTTPTTEQKTTTKSFTKYVKSNNEIMNAYAMTQTTHLKQCLMYCNRDLGCLTGSYHSSTGTCRGSSSTPSNIILADSGNVIFVRESWLHLGDTDMSWDDSQAFCLYLGYKLMEIYSQDENDFVMKYLTEQDQGNVWIGANDKVEENKFVWNDETTEMTYKHFKYPQQPNGGSSQNCVSFDSSYGYWKDKECNNYLRKPLCRKS